LWWRIKHLTHLPSASSLSEGEGRTSGEKDAFFILLINKTTTMKVHKHTNEIFTIDNFCTEQECKDLITMSTETGYAPATINTAMGTRLVPEYRNNTRVFHTSYELADMLWLRLKDNFPIQFENVRPCGLNELFRFYRYEPGERFRKHRDSYYQRNEEEASYFTFLLYLNEGYKGGETAFDDLVITPTTGLALIFFHELLHEGCEILEGTKYVLRSDVMCREFNSG
jgi:prolyl 4-hydroxylase